MPDHLGERVKPVHDGKRSVYVYASPDDIDYANLPT
jgi:hypothetical protein